MKRYIVVAVGLLLSETLMVLVSLGQRPSPSPTATATQPGNKTDNSKFDEAMPLEPIERFEGRSSLKNPRLHAAGQAEIQMTLRNWTIPNRQRIDRFPQQGFLIVQVRSGEDMVTVIDGQRQKHAIDEFFTVPSGSTMSIETGDDTVVLQTLAINSGRAPAKK